MKSSIIEVEKLAEVAAKKLAKESPNIEAHQDSRGHKNAIFLRGKIVYLQ